MHGHADHFLSRLDRVSPAETELALALYRDPAMLRQIIDIVRPDPSRERVAISLGGDDGPFVIVTRDARFITCLGRGMQTYDAAVVPRVDLDHCATTLGRLRDSIAHARALPFDERREKAAFMSVLHDGDRLRREDLVLVQRVQPLMLTALFETYSQTYDRTVGALAELRRRSSFRVDEHPRLRALWRSAWASAHLTTLLTSDAFALTHRYVDGAAALDEVFAGVAWGGMGMGNTALALRGFWTAAQMAPICVDRLEAMARSPDPGLWRSAAVWTLFGAGLRHPAMTTHVTAILESLGASSGRHVAALTPTLLALLRARLDDPDAWEREAVATLRSGAYASGLGPDNELYDDDAVVAWHANFELGIRSDRDATPLLSLLVAWYATRDASLMCQRDAVVRRLQPPWNPEASTLLLEHFRELWTPSQPTRVAATPGRNEPCACGSGKKAKRCCG